MSGHTPGAWFAKRDGWSTVYVEAKLRHRVIQEIAACGPTEAGPEQQDANARLISAAPDLLAIAQEYASGCSECSGTGTPTYGTSAGHPCPDCADIRAVIAKATQP